MKKHFPIIILTIIAAVLIFANLGNQYLWQDEAETAVLAKNTLKYGFPRAYDGKNFVNPRLQTYYGMGFGKNHEWLYHPWVQFYVTAFSFLLFGESTFTARLPFAIIGVVNVLMLYLLAYRLTRERFIAACSAFLLTFSVPYLLLMRQCRYYAPAVFLVLVIFFFYSGYIRRGKIRDLILSSAGLAALAYTVHGMFVPVFAALGLHYLFFSFDRKTFPKVISAAILVIVLVAPWFFVSQSLGHTGKITPGNLWQNLEFQVRMINKYIFPLVFFGAVYLARLIWKKRFAVHLTKDERGSAILISMVLLTSILAFCFAEQRNFRYLVYFIPLLGMMEGMILWRLYRFSRVLLVSFLAVSVMTGVFNMGTPNFLFPKYLYEITHDYDGPVEGIVKFLGENAGPDDTVKLIFGDLPLIFYTDLKVDNSWVYKDPQMHEWIVFRRGWHEQLTNDFYTKVGKTYKKHVLDYPDIKWENRPGDIGYHRFATDKEAPGVIIFEKVEGK
ncbi:MAG: glycosyltransferase family 39 protein [Candidatus Omnitrophota bacterium]|nr:glycosyltransferase family 39 protein [Candidatus Omnitrophota bacterium]